MAIDKIITAITPLKSVEKINEIIEEINNKNTGSGLSIGTIFPCVCSANWTPENALAVDGAEYSSTQFPTLWTDFLTATTPKLATCTYSEYASDIETYGQCAKFAVDTTNNKFKVPTIKDGSYITQALSDTQIGKAYKESLPNITGFAYVATGNTGTAKHGALTRSEDSKTQFSTTSATTHSWANIILDASGSSSTYQDNAKVQGDNVRLRWFVVVATGTTSQSAMDWSAWATSLAGKANADFTNVSATGKSTASGWSFPSTEAITLTAGASESEYTAPANGWFYVQGTSINTFAFLFVGWKTPDFMVVNAIAYNTNNGLASACPVKKGQIVKLNYLNTSINHFKFFYAEGDSSESEV